MEVLYGGESTDNIPVADRLFNLDTYHSPNDIFHCLYLTGNVGMEKDEYCTMMSSERPCCGRESGFMLLSKVGFLRHIDKIKDRFIFLQNNPSDRNRSPQGTWEDFEKAALKFYDGTVKNTKKHINSLNKKINELNNTLIYLS